MFLCPKYILRVFLVKVESSVLNIPYYGTNTITLSTVLREWARGLFNLSYCSPKRGGEKCSGNVTISDALEKWIGNVNRGKFGVDG